MNQVPKSTINLPYLSVYLGGGSLAIIVLVALAAYLGIADGSLLLILPFFASPLLAIAGIVMGSVTLMKKLQPQFLAIVALVCGAITIILFTSIIVLISQLLSALSRGSAT